MIDGPNEALEILWNSNIVFPYSSGEHPLQRARKRVPSFSLLKIFDAKANNFGCRSAMSIVANNSVAEVHETEKLERRLVEGPIETVILHHEI